MDVWFSVALRPQKRVGLLGTGTGGGGGGGRESERLDRGNRPKKTGEAVDRRQNNGSVKAVSPPHCPATCALRNCCFNCCAGQSHKDNVRCTAVDEQLGQAVTCGYSRGEPEPELEPEPEPEPERGQTKSMNVHHLWVFTWRARARTRAEPERRQTKSMNVCHLWVFTWRAREKTDEEHECLSPVGLHVESQREDRRRV